MLTTTLRRLRAKNACANRYAHLVAALGDGWGDDQEISIAKILESNGISDAAWALWACAWADSLAREFAAACAERVLPLYESAYPSDDRPRRAIEAARAYARGEIDAASLSAAAMAVRDAARAARDAAWAAEAAAAGAVDAWSAARAARDASWAAEAAAQIADAVSAREFATGLKLDMTKGA